MDLPLHRTEDLKNTARFRELETVVLDKIRKQAKGGNVRITTCDGAVARGVVDTICSPGGKSGTRLMPAEEPNYLAHAFKSQYNLIGLGTALGFALLSGTLLPIIVAAGIEMVVLPLVSGSGRFQRLVRARTSEEADEQDAARQRMESSEMLQYMPEAERARYRTLQALTNEIRQNYKGMDSSSQMLLEQLVEKLDFLLSFYLRMRYSLTRYQNYFNSTDPERIQERIAMLDHEMKSARAADQGRTRSVLEKRLDH